MSLRAAIFDLDGTLVDSEPLYAASDAAFLGSRGMFLRPGEEGDFVGLGTNEFLKVLAGHFPDNPFSSLPLAERAALKDEAYLDYAKGRLRAFPGAVALAAELRGRGLALAIASGSSPAAIEAELEATSLAGVFGVVVSASEVERGKPAPDVFLEAARRLGVRPSDCLVVEDSRHGVLAASRAGMRCLALAPAGGTEHPDYRLAELLCRGGADAIEPSSILASLEALGLIRA